VNGSGPPFTVVSVYVPAKGVSTAVVVVLSPPHAAVVERTTATARIAAKRRTSVFIGFLVRVGTQNIVALQLDTVSTIIDSIQ
jgi:hypothetical protein